MSQNSSEMTKFQRIFFLHVILLAAAAVLICMIGPYTGVVVNIRQLDFFLDYTFPMVRIREVVSQNINIAGYTLKVSAAEEEGLLAAAMILGGSLPMGLLFIRGLLGIYSLITGGHKKYYALMPGLSLILTASVTVLVRNSLQDYMEKMIGKASGMLDILGGFGDGLSDSISDYCSVPLCWGFYAVCILSAVLLFEDCFLLPRIQGACHREQMVKNRFVNNAVKKVVEQDKSSSYSEKNIPNAAYSSQALPEDDDLDYVDDMDRKNDLDHVNHVDDENAVDDMDRESPKGTNVKEGLLESSRGDEDAEEYRPGIIWVSGERSGQISYLKGNQIFYIGRSEDDNDVTLSEISVSRRHCNICYLKDRGGYVIEDTSTNGVFISGHRLDRGKKYLVKPGAAVSIGLKDTLRLL